MRILFATDGLSQAGLAADLIERLFDPDRVHITVFSAAASNPIAEKPSYVSGSPLRYAEAAQLVDQAAERFIASGFTATGLVAEGHPGPEIMRALGDDWYDIVALGAGNHSWYERVLLGSCSTYVLHSSPTSTLIVHDVLGSTERPTVLLGADGSRGADVATRVLSASLRQKVHVTALSVVPPFGHLMFPLPGTPGMPIVVEEQEKEIRTQRLQRGERYAQSLATRLADAHLHVSHAATEGNPIQVLLKETEGGQFDLLAVGSRGLGPVRRALLGSVSDQVARHARAALIARRLPS